MATDGTEVVVTDDETVATDKSAVYRQGYEDGRSGDRPSESGGEYGRGYKDGRLEYLKAKREKDLRGW